MPFDSSQLHRSGVRLGKCQASKNRNQRLPPAGIVWRIETEATGVEGSTGVPRLPVFVNSSNQKCCGPMFHGPTSHPSRHFGSISTEAPAAGRAARTNDPCMGSSPARDGSVIKTPLMPVAVRAALLRLSDPPTGFEIDQATTTSASVAPGL